MSRCSIMEFFGQDDGHKCGYCKSEGSSISHGMWAHSMTVLEYQTLIDQGWRRSGRYLYKPEMSKTCCPQYTIKLAVKDFKPSKSHKKVLRKLRNYISRDKGGPKGGDQIDGGDSSDDSMDVTDSAEPKETATARMELAQSKIKAAESELSHVTATPEPSIGPSSSEPNDKDDRVDGANPTTTTSGPPSSSSSSKTLSEAASSAALPPPKRGLGADPNKPKARKAKELRRERAEKKGKIPQKREPKNKEKGLSDFIDAPFPPDAKHTFELRMISAQTEDPEFMRSFNESYNVYKKYQVAIHKDKPDSITKKQFTRFLCNSSLIQEPIPRSGSPGKQFGAYHQQYLIDGRIVCVGVVDVLSSCVSSVYLYYDPDFAFLSPGVFTSLYEIHYVSTLEQFDIPFYYMGFYIHSCPKMRYKSQYSPSQLLCPVTYNWVDVASSCSRLDAQKFSRLSDDDEWKKPKSKFTFASSDRLMNEVKVLYERSLMPLWLYRQVRSDEIDYSVEEEEPELEEFINLVGEEAAKSLVLFRGS